MVSAVAQITGKRTNAHLRRARLNVLVPIGIVVAVAILCIVVAVLTSAQRANEVAAEQERRLFSRLIEDQADRNLRELESVAVSDIAYRNVRTIFNSEWVQRRIGLWLRNFYDHDYVFVVNARDRLVYTLLGNQSVEPSLFNSVAADLERAINVLRGRSYVGPAPLEESEAPAAPPMRYTTAQSFMGRPAVVSATLVRAPDAMADLTEAQNAPIAFSVKFIDESVLHEIANRLGLIGLRQQGNLPGPDEHSFNLVDRAGHTIAMFAWKPRQPGAEIVGSVTPFIVVALGGFAMLAGLFYGHVRRSAATIAEGEQQLRHLALHDPLSGLPNRHYFGERLETAIAEVRGGGHPAAVFYIDLDHFKDVNDTLGHPVGDELIRNVTMRLAQGLRDGDVVARLGGDEFALLTTTIPGQDQAAKIAERLIAKLCAPYQINGQSIVIGASVGIAPIDGRVHTAADVMRYADMALYRAKNEGRNRACAYDAEMDANLTNRKRLESDLREAIEADEMRLVYQPILNASGEKTVGVEALSRWWHPTRGEIPPSVFIPIAENSGLINDLGENVLRQACRDGLAWPGLTIAVNVSPLQFRRPDFVEVVQRILAETAFDPARLELELTESTLLGNVDSAESAMRRLKAMGVRLALDDFGTGYSSLAYLRRFPFDKLKIDRSFIRSIENAQDNAAIVHAIVGLGRGLGMKVTAEGVETAEQHLFLRAAGVHFMQGFRFSVPCGRNEISAKLAAQLPYRSISGDAAALAG